MSSNKFLEEFFNCPICYEIMTNPTTTICGHNFCADCITKNNNYCPICRKKLQNREITINYQLKKSIEDMKNMKEDEIKRKYFNQNTYKEKDKNSNFSPLIIHNTNIYTRSTFILNRNMNEDTSKYRVKRRSSEINAFSELDYHKYNNEHYNVYQNQRIQFDNHKLVDRYLTNVMNDLIEVDNMDSYLDQSVQNNNPTPSYNNSEEEVIAFKVKKFKLN